MDMHVPEQVHVHYSLCGFHNLHPYYVSPPI